MKSKSIRTKTWKLGALILLCAAVTACSIGGTGGTGGTGGNGGNGGTGNNGVAGNAGGASADAGSPSGADDVGTTVVTMSVMTKDRFLQEAEQKFESAHPNIDIQIEETAPSTAEAGKSHMVSRRPGQPVGPDPEQVDKYVNTVNTAVMSGKAADIIAVEHLPAGKYMEQGLIADWNELANADAAFDRSDYYEAIFDGASQDGFWYGIPTSYSLSVMVGDDSLLSRNGLSDTTWTWDQFVQLLEKQGTQGGQTGIANMKPEELLAYLAESVYEQLVKQDGGSVHFDAEAFQAYMEKIKGLYDSGLASAEQTDPGSTSFNYMSMQMPFEITSAPKMAGSGGKMLRPPGTGQDEGIPYKSSLVLALNAKSEAKAAAWEFVKFLLSDDMQASNAQMGFAVNQQAMEMKLKQMQEMMSGGSSGGMRMTIKGKDGASYQLTDEDIAEILSVLPSVGKYQNRDAKVLEMIREESAAYYSGSKPAKAVAGTLANRIDTYLNE